MRKKSEALEKVDDDLRRLMDDMLETMYAAPGIGLAAVQVGILKRLIVIDISKDKEKKEPLFLVNPEIKINPIIPLSVKKVVYHYQVLCRNRKTGRMIKYLITMEKKI